MVVQLRAQDESPRRDSKVPRLGLLIVYGTILLAVLLSPSWRSTYVVLPIRGGNATESIINIRRSNESIPSSSSSSSSSSSLPFKGIDVNFVIPPIPDNDIERKVQDAIAFELNNASCPLTNCSVTNQVRLEINSTGHWILHSLHNGQPKTMGGDDFYVTFHDYGDPQNSDNYTKKHDPTAVAITSYLGNGTYYLDFVEPPMRSIYTMSQQEYTPAGIGFVTVYFTYTCSVGSWNPHLRPNWKNNGSSRASYVQQNVSSPKFLRPYQFPPILQRGTGSAASVDLSLYDNVLCFGDSVTRQFCGAGRFTSPPQFRKANVKWYANIGTKLVSNTVDTLLAKLTKEEALESLLLASANGTNSTALIMGSAAWDILLPNSQGKPNFDDHLVGLEQLIKKVRKAYPNVTILWKSPQAFHAHVLKEPCYNTSSCIMATRHMSNFFAQELSFKQEKLMDKLGVPFLDVLEASFLSAVWHYGGDGIHYEADFNWALFNLTYPDDYPEGKPKWYRRRQLRHFTEEPSSWLEALYS